MSDKSKKSLGDGSSIDSHPLQADINQPNEDQLSPDEAEPIHYVNLYEASDKVYLRKTSGFYQNIRRFTGIPLLLGFLLLPWLSIDGRPAMLFDLPTRQFFIFWWVFGPQDGMYLAWLLIISAFSLFTITALLGRVWCGFTCPQTVWTLMFVWVELFCEGDRNKRIKLDKAPWNLEKFTRKSSKYILWFVIAFVTGLTFIGYFVPIRELAMDFVPLLNESGHWIIDGSNKERFWVLFFTFMTYMNAGFLREQVCIYMCPYARFQSVMYDEDTLAVHYDSKRGEMRGPRKAGEDYNAQGKGDCIDCSWCVQVCPVDIDIRDGLQYACINCGLCVDACNSVMDKVGYERGLIRFTSEDQLKNGETHFLRPRVFGYAGMIVAMVLVFGYFIMNRDIVTLDVDRDRSARMYRLQGDQVQNVYTLKVHNMDTQSHTFDLQVNGPVEFEVLRYRALPLESGEIFSFPVRIAASSSVLNQVKTQIEFKITSQTNPDIQTHERSTFIGPDN